MKIILAASGSGGHVYPCLALGNYLKIQGHDIIYLKIDKSYENKINEYNPSYTLKIKRNVKLNFKSFNSIKNFIYEVKKAKNHLKEYDIILCFGGIMSFVGPLIKNKKQKLFIHEQNVVLGDSNIFASFYSRKIFLSLPLKNSIFNNKKILLSGNPREQLIEKNSDIKNTIVFMSGSLGSTTLNKIYLETIKELNIRQKIVLIGNFNKEDFINKNVEILNKELSLNDILNKSKIVITRGGATTLSEVCKAQIPMIIIPSPYVKHNHQEKNANYFKNIGVAVCLKENDLLKNELLITIKKLIENNDVYYSYVKNYQKIKYYNAFKIIEEEMINEF
ncbi:MAG: UDP-N-acetylglucosamine--N-acetylmuramyl-(pentapeptide) pyrophosphoryl-undecaprenol N-acetylglucosamine transferase [Bacilli bacterium]